MNHNPNARTAALIALTLAGTACVEPGIPVVVEGGRIALNDTLRRDMGPTVSVSPSNTFSDGNCRGPAGADPKAPCHLVSPVLGSLMHAHRPDLAQRLRKAPNLWVTGGNGFARLSFEIVAEDVTLRDRDKDVELDADANFGSCDRFPGLDKDTREIQEAIRGVIVTENYADHLEVDVRRCSRASIPAISTVGDLGAVTANCDSESVTQLLAGREPPHPQNPPMCVIDLGAATLMTDVSFSLLPSQRDGASFVLEDVSPGMEVKALPLPTHLKVVPAGGIRTISRPLEYIGNAEADGERWIHRYQWRVPTEGQELLENFSPNITVVAARVRQGNPTAMPGDYRPVEALKIGSTLCKTRDDSRGFSEFDVVLCEPMAPFPVSPAYSHPELAQSTGLDPSLIWQVRLWHDTEEQPGGSYHLELDLTAIGDTGTSGSGLTAAPASIDLGTQRVGAQVPAIDAFEVGNFGVASVRVRSVTLTGPQAAEFGQPTTSAGVPPFDVAGGDGFAIRLQPQFASMSRKNAVTEVRFIDHAGRQGTIAMPVIATAVEPSIIAVPGTLRLFAAPDSASGETSSAVRAAVLINGGAVAFDRLGVSVEGADAARFAAIRSEHELDVSDPGVPLAIGPGETETYRVQFLPDRIGEFHATLVIETSEGEAVVGLWGVCDTACGERPEPGWLLPRPPPEFEFREGPLFRILKPKD
ncbi:MAG: hypothetical protein MJA32_03620 [Proteobacteria bacterium]|nr:hypothetical protein [Pseudomonadota bacterium]